MKTLIIDTSHERSLVAFANGIDILLTIPLPIGFQSSSHLFPAIRSGLQELKITPQDLESIVVAVGPGSFTGIRVGVAAAKGMAAPCQLPLYKVCSLWGFAAEKQAAVIDARVGGAFVLIPGGEPKFISKEKLDEELAGVETIVGPNLQNFEFSNKIERDPDPKALLKNAQLCERGDLELLYLR